MTIKHSMLVLLLTLSWVAHADGLYTGAWSYHYYQDAAEAAGKDINSNQNLLAYEHNNFMVGYFKNSFGHDSLLVGIYIDIYEFGDFQTGLYLGLNYGYRWCGKDYSNRTDPVVCPHGIPEIRYTKHKLQPALLIFQEGGAIGLRWDI